MGDKLIMIKKLSLLFLVLCTLLLVSCRKEETNYMQYASVAFEPETNPMTGEYELDFIAMHNYVITELESELTPFFYIVNGKFDISGDNETKTIEVKCQCLDGTIEDDVDLFFSMVLNYIGFNAHEQDVRFEAPITDEEGTYINFGSVFDTYNLTLFADTQSGKVIKDVHVKHGNKIPVDSRYIKES